MSQLERAITASGRAAARPSARGVCFWYQSLHVARAEASCRYRIGHFIELTRGADVVIDTQLPADVARRVHTIVCVRPCVTPNFKRALLELKRGGAQLVADYDDLLFAGDVSGLPASARGSGDGQEQRQRLHHYAAALDVFDRFIVSTRALAQHLSALAPDARVTVVPNGLSTDWVTQGRTLYPVNRPASPPVIRYFAGSPSHDSDIASIMEPLCSLLHRHPQVHLEFVGHVSPPNTSSLPAARVKHVPPVAYDELPKLLGTTWVNIAPLVESNFTNCKSAIKFLEAAAFNCPTLASANDDMLRHRELGAPLTLCRTADDWQQHLEALLDPQQRESVATAAARHVALHGMARVSLASWFEGLKLRSVAQ